jgi:hypothetical protein
VGIDATDAALGQLVSQTSTDDSGAVQAENGIHKGAIDNSLRQMLGYGLRLAQTGLGIGNIDVVIDMAVVGSKVTASKPQGNISMTHGQVGNFDHIGILRICEIKKANVFWPRQTAFLPVAQKTLFFIITRTRKYCKEEAAVVLPKNSRCFLCRLSAF